MRVIGIDPGTTTTGWGIVESNGQTLRHVANGCIRTQTGESLPNRLGKIFAELTRIIVEHQPQQAIVEEIFVSQNVQSALKLGHARGVAIAAANHQGLPIHEYTALQVKKSVVGYGHADKQQMQEMVRILLCMSKSAPQDAADALGVAICHLNHLPNHLLRASVSAPAGASA
ncbi:MAG: crossover junction endodeoxyribonuclease RuvC [Magnetococcales bacterium]|nr:crossover junction endodeoxyribonuclease RuvC [Magnetococcales bacterium]